MNKNNSDCKTFKRNTETYDDYALRLSESIELSAAPEYDINDPANVNAVFTALNGRIFELYRFVLRYNGYIYSSHSYGDEEAMTMIDVHTLSYIDDNPGCTPSDLVRYWEKTKGAISQILGRLEKAELIVRQRCRESAKVINLFVTKKGARVSQAHKIYDIKDLSKTLSRLMERCSPDEIRTFYKVIGIYNDIIKEDLEINSGIKNKGGRKGIPRM